jgi:hypothetical protein
VWNLVAQVEGETRLRILKNRMFRRIFGSKRDEKKGSVENYIMRSAMI